MEGAPSEGQTTGSQIHPQLRQRMLNRAATFAEGAQPSMPTPARRRSSLISDLSDTRHPFRSSTDNLLNTTGHNAMDKQVPHDGPTFWTSLPVAIALVPPIIGLTVQDGAAIATDMVILGLAAWFLNCCVRVPWDWYHEAQQRRYDIDLDEMPDDSTILEEDEDGIDGQDEQPEENIQRPTSSDKTSPTTTTAQEQARTALKREEMWAFALCFVGPILGALLLHKVRGQLTRAEGIVSDFNLGIFVLGSEIRPVRRLVQMRSERILHLQRIVRSSPRDEWRGADVNQLGQRLAELEARLDGPGTNSDVDISKLSAQVQHSTQLQLDALNRAVRRYEKRATVQNMQYEARFHELDAQLRDALALAAAAARTGQRPGLITTTMSWLASMINHILQTSWNVATYPLRTAGFAVAVVESWFLGDKREARKRSRGPVNGHSSLSTPRMQSKAAR